MSQVIDINEAYEIGQLLTFDSATPAQKRQLLQYLENEKKIWEVLMNTVNQDGSAMIREQAL
ncbi:MAG: hypothetical protein R3240_06670 [Gammaproteobacteria bacterium]|nr:hypothetical protein [Gammaproteobacteria bacterium]